MDNIGFEFISSFGKVVDIAPDFSKTNLTSSLFLNLKYQTKGDKFWQELYNFPKIGLAFQYTNLGNPNLLGNTYSILPNISFKSKKNKKYKIATTFGIGLAYFNNFYDRSKNEENKYVGSRITALAYANFLYVFPIGENLNLKTGIGINHYSNGHVQLPNIGLNIPRFSLGLEWKNSKQKVSKKPVNKKLDLDKKIRLNLRFGLGIHELGSSTKPNGGAKYPIYIGSFYASKRTHFRSNFHLGITARYYTSFYDFIILQELFPKREHLKAMNFSVFLGHEFLFGKLGLLTQMGVNVYNPFVRKTKNNNSQIDGFKEFSKIFMPSRFGLNYYFQNPMASTKNKMYLGLYIKANFGQADFLGSTLGFTF